MGTSVYQKMRADVLYPPGLFPASDSSSLQSYSRKTSTISWKVLMASFPLGKLGTTVHRKMRADVLYPPSLLPCLHLYFVPKLFSKNFKKVKIFLEINTQTLPVTFPLGKLVTSVYQKMRLDLPYRMSLSPASGSSLFRSCFQKTSKFSQKYLKTL